MRWLDNVSTDLRKMRINEWRDRARNREAWRRIVKEAKAHPGLLRRRRRSIINQNRIIGATLPVKARNHYILNLLKSTLSHPNEFLVTLKQILQLKGSTLIQ